jgi:CheY-like chemotaxis protein
MATILVVDDHPDMREVLVRLLEMRGHAADSCDSARTALDYLAGKIPSAVVVDDRMAPMDGLEVVRRIRANPDWSSLFVVVCSADETCRPRALAAGADEFWVKGSEMIFKAVEQLSDTLQNRKS